MKKMLCVYAIVVCLLCCLTKLELCFGKSTLRVLWVVVLLNKQNSKKPKHNKTYIDSKLCTVPAVVLHWQLYKFHVSLKLLSYVLSLTNICWKNSILRGSHKQRWKKNAYSCKIKISYFSNFRTQLRPLYYLAQMLCLFWDLLTSFECHYLLFSRYQI